jgi:hypothetical protein
MATHVWGAETAAVYDAGSREMFDPARLDPCVDVLAALAGPGPRSSSPSASDGWRCR